jgi:hypothetical protein
MARMPRPLVVLDVLMAVLFALSAALQYNDPDPLRWAALYGAAAVACIVVWRRPAAWPLAALAGSIALLWAATFAPAVLPGFEPRDLVRTMKAGTPRIEESREMLGLLVVAAWMALLVVVGRRRLRPRARRRA